MLRVEPDVGSREIAIHPGDGVAALNFGLKRLQRRLRVEDEVPTLTRKQADERILIVAVHLDPDSIPVRPVRNEILIDLRDRERTGQVLRPLSLDLLDERSMKTLEHVIRHGPTPRIPDE